MFSDFDMQSEEVNKRLKIYILAVIGVAVLSIITAQSISIRLLQKEKTRLEAIDRKSVV